MRVQNFIIGLGLGLCLVITVTFLQAQNYDESKIPNYELPHILIEPDGQTIENKEQWSQIRRDEILRIFEEYMYGKVPDFEYKTEIYRRKLDTKLPHAIQEEVVIAISSTEGRIRLNMLLTLPKSTSTGVPVFLGLNFHGNHVTSENDQVSMTSNYVINNSSLGITNHLAGKQQRGKRASRWPVENLLKNGYGLATIHCGDIDPDIDDGFKNGAHSLVASDRAPNQWGTIAAWAWGLSRAMDYLVSDDRVDAKRVAVVGHSRLGKAALWAGAVDTRFAMVISNNSGCGGAALSRRRIGETVAAINTSFPHWFCKNFHQYNEKEDDLPIDQHMLLALIAPRPVYVASASEDQWADPKGEYISLQLSSAVYDFYQSEVIQDKNPPSPDKPLWKGKQGYHLRTGKHDITPYDWQQFMEFADQNLGKK